MIKRNIFRVVRGLLICLGCVFLLISQIKLDKDRDRNCINYTIDSDLRNQVIEISNSSNTPQDVVKGCSKLVCDRLSFAAKNDIPKGKANCVGYAQLTSSVINYAFQVKMLPYRAKPVVGKVYLFGINLNNVAQKILPKKHRPFFIDHDFVEVELGDKTIYVDSSLQDLTGLTFMQIHNQ